MQQLSEMDANFLEQESKRTPMHISPVIFYDQSKRKGGKLKFDEIMGVFNQNLHKSTIFRRKVVGGAMGIDTPYWVEDPRFDLSFHVREVSLPKPGNWRQLCTLLARLQATGLDMKRPLWEAYVIAGLDNIDGMPKGSFAIMLKIHHAAIDGVSGAEIITAIHSLSDSMVQPDAEDDWHEESDPSPWKIWSQAYLHSLKKPFTFVDKVSHLIPSAIKAARQANEDGSAAKDKPPLVRTRFNGLVSSSRVMDALVMDLAVIKALSKTAPELTVNDVIVAIVGGGMRRYLSAKDELPETTLSCAAPINMRDQSNSESAGNQVSQMTISMATDIADPIERLHAVNQSATEAKAFAATLGSSVLMDVSETMFPRVLGWAMQAATYTVGGSAIPVPSHVVISNVPGPQVPLYLGGAKVHMMVGMGPLLHAMGLFHAVLSGAGRICISFTSCPKMLPDPEFYKQCLQESFDEMCDKAKL